MADLVPHGSRSLEPPAPGPPPAVELELPRTTPTRVLVPLFAALGGLLLAVSLATGPVGRAVMMLALGAIVVGLIGFTVLLPRTTRVRVGDDGLWVSGLGRPRFIGFDQLSSVSLDSKGVELTLVGGERVDILIARSAQSPGIRLPDVATTPEPPPGAPLYRAIIAAQQRHRGAPPDVVLPLPLLAAAREVNAGLEPLRALARPQAYRGGISADELWPLVENPRVAASARAAAAVALTPALGEPGRSLLLAHAAATALPSLRLAFRAVASGDDQALHAAIEALRLGE